MNRLRLARAAVRLYPADIRAERQDELIGTMLDAGEHSTRVFLGQLVSVMNAGLLARSRAASTQPVRDLASDTIRCCAVMFVGMGLIFTVVEYAHWGPGPGSIPIAYDTICPAVIVTAFVLGLDRAAGLTGIAYLVYWNVTHTLAPTYVSIQNVILLAGFGLMTLAPRRRRDDLRVLTLIPLLAEAFFRWTELGLRSGVGYLLPALTAAMLITIRPSLALGTALASSLISFYWLTGFAPPAAYELLCCAPAAFVLAGLSRRAFAEL